MTTGYQTLISADDALKCSGDNNVVIIDTRFYLDDVTKGRKEFLGGHVPGAVYLDIALDLSSPVIKGITGRHPLPHPEVLAGTLRAAGMNNHSQVIVYDQGNGAQAARAWWLLKWLGHDNVAVLDGGYASWHSVMGPIDNQWTLPTPGNFDPQLKHDLIAWMAEVESTTLPLVDSREYRRYTGEFEPIDPVAGHIPGAICIPYMDNNLASGYWKNKPELEETFSALKGPEQNPPIFYCGSGVTACHNILSYKIATGRDAKLYPGGWSEWIQFHKI